MQNRKTIPRKACDLLPRDNRPQNWQDSWSFRSEIRIKPWLVQNEKNMININESLSQMKIINCCCLNQKIIDLQSLRQVIKFSFLIISKELFLKRIYFINQKKIIFLVVEHEFNGQWRLQDVNVNAQLIPNGKNYRQGSNKDRRFFTFQGSFAPKRTQVQNHSTLQRGEVYYEGAIDHKTSIIIGFLGIKPEKIKECLA